MRQQRSNLGVSRAYRSLYGDKDAQDFRVSTHPKPLLKSAFARAGTSSRIPEAKRQALVDALANPAIQPELEVSRAANQTWENCALEQHLFHSKLFVLNSRDTLRTCWKV